MNEQRMKLVRELYESRLKADYKFSQKRLPNLKGIEFGVPQLGILLTLNHAGAQRATVKQLTEITKKSSSAITQLVEGLEKDGYVDRKRSNQDRRLVYVHLTELGKKKFADFYIQLIESLAHITETLSDKDLREYIRINQIIADQI